MNDLSSARQSAAQPARSSALPLLLGLFEKRIEGDDSLLELARLRFQQAGLDAEMHAETPEQHEQDLKFRPSEQRPVVLHLPRDFNLTEENTRRQVSRFAFQFAGRVCGMVLHDHPDLTARPEAFVQAARAMNSQLETIAATPKLFVEYAASLEPAAFAEFFGSIRELEHISACIDSGHLGIWQARRTFSQVHPGEDVCALKSQPASLPQLMPDVDAAVASALPVVLDLIRRVGALGKPLHFHLHDGHPLSTFSPFGVSDHLSFLAAIPLRFEHRGRRLAPLMFGQDGLKQIVAAALQAIAPEHVSLTLEIHPTFERRPLGDAAHLFRHWTDKTNAEKMNHWLRVLAQNQALVRRNVLTPHGTDARAYALQLRRQFGIHL